MRKKERQRLEREGYDLDFVTATQPQANIQFRATYTRVGTGYI